LPNKYHWIPKDRVISWHRTLLEIYGGPEGLRDEGLLESALARPKNLLVYEKPSLFDLGASYGYGLINNHPFVDGNKRIGFAVMTAFLKANGSALDVSERQATEFTFDVAAGDRNENELAEWLRLNAN
jgi:death-on-curing protein